MAAVRDVFFVYRRSSTKFGSTIVRGHQLCEIAKRHLAGRYNFSLIPISKMRLTLSQHIWVAARRPGIYISVKDAVDQLGPEPLAALRRKAHAICIDYVDRPLSRLRLDSVDIHIACSHAGLAVLERTAARNARARLLLHNVDLRLEDVRPEPQGRMRMVYFGGLRNTTLSPRATTMVDVVSAERSKDMAENYSRLSGYNGHYCIRRPNPEADLQAIHKPFTKGFIAATLGCPVLVDRQVEDALHFLGDAYPFLVPDASDAAIDAGLDRMQAAFGGSDWRAALDIMEHVRYRVTPAAIARDLKTILDEIG